MGAGRRGTEGAREEPTDLSFILDCSMAETYESVKPKNSAASDISDMLLCEKAISCLQGVFSHGPLSDDMVVDAVWRARLAHQALLAHCLWEGLKKEGSTLMSPLLLPCSLSLLAYILPGNAVGPHCHPKPAGTVNFLGSDLPSFGRLPQLRSRTGADSQWNFPKTLV